MRVFPTCVYTSQWRLRTRRIGALQVIASILFYYYIVKVKTDYINSDYSDVRYRVYIWGFPYLDYSFDVLISLIGNVSLYNWFPVITLLTVLFHVLICLYSRYTFLVHMYLLCTSFGFIYVLAGLRLTTLNSHVQILVPGPWWHVIGSEKCIFIIIFTITFSYLFI